MGIIRRVREDGPDGGGADLKILPRSVEHAIRGLMDEVRCQWATVPGDQAEVEALDAWEGSGNAEYIDWLR